MYAAATSATAIIAGRNLVNLDALGPGPDLTPMLSARVGQEARHSPHSMQSTALTLPLNEGTSML